MVKVRRVPSVCEADRLIKKHELFFYLFKFGEIRHVITDGEQSKWRAELEQNRTEHAAKLTAQCRTVH